MFKENIEALLSRLENMVTTRTIVGEPMACGNITMIPIVSASFGFGLGGGEGSGTVKDASSGGGAGGGIRPVALVVLQAGDVKLYSLAPKGTLETLAGVVPEVLARVGKCRQEAG